MRWSIVGLATACAIALGSLVYGRIASTTPYEEQDWRHRELAFLMAVHDRLQAELAHRPAGAASLRSEDRSILQAMAVVAKSMSTDSVPVSVRMLVVNFDLSTEELVASSIETVMAETSVGLPPVFAAWDAGEGFTARPPTGVAAAPKPAVSTDRAPRRSSSMRGRRARGRASSPPHRAL